MNKIIAGDYKGRKIRKSGGRLYFSIYLIFPYYINKKHVSGYEVIDQNKRTSASSVYGRALVGSLIRPVGAVAGAMSAKKKGTYYVAVEFTTGKRSLLEVNEKYYKIIMRDLF